MGGLFEGFGKPKRKEPEKPALEEVWDKYAAGQRHPATGQRERTTQMSKDELKVLREAGYGRGVPKSGFTPEPPTVH